MTDPVEISKIVRNITTKPLDTVGVPVALCTTSGPSEVSLPALTACPALQAKQAVCATHRHLGSEDSHFYRH